MLFIFKSNFSFLWFKRSNKGLNSITSLWASVLLKFKSLHLILGLRFNIFQVAPASEYKGCHQPQNSCALSPDETELAGIGLRLVLVLTT